MTLHGKKNNITRNDLDALADYLEIPPRVRYQKFVGTLSQIEQLLLGEGP